MTKTIIKLPYGVQKKVAETLRISERTIINALKYNRDTEKCRKIRHIVLKEFGGVEYKQNS